MNKYIERLCREWLQYKNIIIAVDYDSTVSPYHTIDNPEDIAKCIELLKKAREVGCYIIVHTSCNEDRYEDIQKTFRDNGITIDSINENPFDLPFGHNRKPYFNILLDDRAGFKEALDILEKSIYNTIGAKKPNYPDVA